jgi:hypothetical protein
VVFAVFVSELGAALLKVVSRGPIHSSALGSVLAGGFPHGPKLWVEVGTMPAKVVPRGPNPPTAVRTVSAGRKPHGPDSPGPAAAILRKADKLWLP